MILPERSPRWLLALVVACLAACSSEDARQAASTASALRATTENAVASFAALQARAKKEPASWAAALDPTTGIVQDQLRQHARDRDAYLAVTADARVKQLRAQLPRQAVPLEQASLRQLQPVLERAALIEQAAAAHARAWPLGTEHLVCMREHVLAYGHGMRRAALQLNAPTEDDAAGPLYQAFDNELADLTVPLRNAVASGDALAATAAVERIRARVEEERLENARVQLAFARSAQAAAAVVDAIDRAGSIRLADLLAMAQSLLPRLSPLAGEDEVASGLRTLGRVSGRLDADTWLTALAQQPLAQAQCAIR